SEPGSAVAEGLDQVIQAGERAASLTRSLLAFGRKQVMAPVVADLNAVVGSLEKFLGRVIGEDVELKTRLTAEPVRVRIDQSQIEQSVVNLATNSRDSMPQGGQLLIETSRVEISAALAEARGFPSPGTYAALSVADTGAGIDPATLKRIFE